MNIIENICDTISSLDSEELFVEVGTYIDQRFVFCESLGWGRENLYI